MAQHKKERPKCLKCDKPVKTMKNKYCSVKCLNEVKSESCIDKNKQRNYSNNPNLKRSCVICNNAFVVERPCRKQKCCSYECGRKLRWDNEYQQKAEQRVSEMKDYRKTHTRIETAEHFCVSTKVLTYWEVNGPEKEKRISCPSQLTQEQEETITGNLLGDGCISWIDNTKGDGDINNRFTIGQMKGREEYINYLFEIYAPFSSCIYASTHRKPGNINGKVTSDIKYWNGEYSYANTMHTISHPIFTSLRQKWYKESDIKRSPKIIPIDLKLTWRTAAIWMVDDGYNCIKNRRLGLCTDCFTCNEVEFLINCIKKDLGVSARISLKRNKVPNIAIYGDEWFNFIDGIKPFVPWECFQYKIKNRNKICNKNYKNTSGFTGIYKSKGKWVAQKRINGKTKRIGGFATIEEAVNARDNYI